MRGTTVRVMFMALAATIALTAFSCTREKTPQEEPKKALPALPAEQGERERVEKARQIKVARVNGAEITMHDLVKEMNRIAPRLIPDASRRTPETDARVKQAALSLLIFRELALQDALRQGLHASPQAVDDLIGKLRASLGSEDAYKAYLQKSGLTEESLRKQAEKDVLYSMIIDKEIYKKVKTSGKSQQEAMPIIEKRKQAWEKELRKNTKVEILLPEAEKK